MRLEQMYRNVLDFSLEDLIVKVEEDSLRRSAALEESMSKNAAAPKERSMSTKLSDQEKAILKALGLSVKDVKALQGNLL